MSTHDGTDPDDRPWLVAPWANSDTIRPLRSMPDPENTADGAAGLVVTTDPEDPTGEATWRLTIAGWERIDGSLTGVVSP